MQDKKPVRTKNSRFSPAVMTSPFHWSCFCLWTTKLFCTLEYTRTPNSELDDDDDYNWQPIYRKEGGMQILDSTPACNYNHLVRWCRGRSFLTAFFGERTKSKSCSFHIRPGNRSTNITSSSYAMDVVWEIMYYKVDTNCILLDGQVQVPATPQRQ